MRADFGRCAADCQSDETCGNGVVDVNINSSEECDDGKTEDDDDCRSDCTLPRCGDGIIDPYEGCDDGANNANTPDACRENCQLPRCGDGIVDTGEACDS